MLTAAAFLLTALAASVSAVTFPNLQQGASVSLNPSTLQYAGQLVQISWSGIKNPTINDAILLQVPANASLLTVFPVKYRWVGTSSTYMSGSGTFTFKVLNYRSDMIFLYARNVTVGTNGTIEWDESDDVTGFQDTDIVAASPVMTIANPNEPTHVHSSYTADDGEVLVQWITRDAGQPTVQWGLRPGNYNDTEIGNYSTYTRADMCGAPANTTGYYAPGIMNQALMAPLPPSTRIYYRVGDPKFGFSPEFSMLTPAATGPSSEVYFIAWADSGQATGDMTNEWDWSDSNPLVTAPYNTRAQKNATLIDVWQQDEAQQGASLDLTRRVTTEVNMGRNVTLFVFNGDISYARGSVGQWDTFGDQYQPIFSQAPVMMVPGNHERDWPNTGDRFYPLVNADDSGGECGFAYGKRFVFPQPSFDQQWYTFEHGPITFIQMSTEQPFGAGSPQWIFIVNALQTIDRSRTPWVIVGLHRPIYTWSIYGNNFKSDVNVAEDLRNSLEEVFYQYQVDLTWAGHVHLYGRTCPVLKRTCLGYNATDGTANGPVHIAMGNGGFEFTWFANPTPPSYWDSSYMAHGYNRVYANGTYIHMQSVESDTGRVIDEFSLVKPKGWKPNYKGRLNQLYYFFSNYTEEHWYEKGINTDALFTTPIYLPATEVFDAKPQLVDMLSIMNTTLLQDINAPDSVVDLAQIFKVYQAAFNDPSFYGYTPQPGVSSTYLKEAIQPLLQLFINNAARSMVDPSFDPATFLATKNAGAPAASRG